MGLIEGPVSCKERSTLQVSKRIGLYPRVRVSGGGSGAVSQAGHPWVRLEDTHRLQTGLEEVSSAKTDKATWYVSKARAAPA
jgi:hypothetical protein